MTLDNALEKKNHNFRFSAVFKEPAVTLQRDRRIMVETVVDSKIKTNYLRCNTTI